MSDSTHNQSGRSDEPQCYNCGGKGHWAVACHEPTRETPAGLAAWRSSSNTKQDNNRSQHSDGRRSKGPIITKYAPPPAPGYAPGYQHPPTNYPQPHGPYSGPSTPQYPPQYQYAQNRAGLPPPPPPGYGQQPYHQPPYTPPAPYGAPHAGQPYPGPPPPGGAAPPNPPMPPGYGPYPGYGQDGHGSFVPPRPAYSGSYPPSASNNKRHHQQHSPPPRPPASSPPGKPATPAAAKAPAPPPAPGTGALSLPPKPPKSVHEFQGPIQDHRNNKRKNDRQNRNRDNRDNRDNKQRDPSVRNQGSPKRPQNAQNRRPSHGQHNQQPDRRGQRPGSKDGHVPAQGGHASPPASLQRRQSSNGSDSTRTATIPPSASPLERPSTQDSAKAEPASSNHGVSSSILDKPNPSLPPKPVVTAENLPPVKIDVGPESAKAPVEYERRDNSLSRRAEEPDSDQRSDSRSQRNGARSRDPYSDSEDSRDRPVKRIRRDSRERRRSPSPGRYRDDDDLPRRDTSRSRSRQRQSSGGSHRSRSSSASSRSSGLDSLEAELLGRPVKRSMSDGSDMKKKAEKSMPTKIKKRRQTNSAFSRRW